MKNILIGVGNVLFKDEGVGIFAAHYLEQNYTFQGEIEILDGGTLGFKLMSFFQEYDNVIILDTVSIEDKAGTVYKLPSKVLLDLGTYRKTAHEVEIIEMLEICSLLEHHASVTVLGIVPQDIESVQIGLTPELEDSFEDYIQQALRQIESFGVHIVAKEEKKSIAQVAKSLMGSYNNEYDARIPNNEDMCVCN